MNGNYSFPMQADMTAQQDKIFDIFATVEIVNIVLSFVVNSFLMWAVLLKSKDLGAYKYLLLAFTLNDIYFPIVHALTLPIICSFRDAFFMFSHGFLRSKFSVCLFAASHSQAMPIIANLFIYRLVALKWSSRLSFYTSFNTSLLVLFCVVAQQILWFSSIWFGYDSDDELRAYVRPLLDLEFPGEGDGHVGALYYDLGAYKYLLLAFTLNDIYFPIVHALTLPIICSYRDAFFMFSHGFLRSKFSVCVFAASHSQAMPIIANLFIYRLVALKWPSRLSFYTSFNTSLLVLFSVVAQQILWFSSIWFGYDSDDELRAYVRPLLDLEFPGEGDGHVGALYYNKEGLRSTAVLATMALNTIMTFWISLIVSCSLMIVRYFRNSSNTLSSKTERLQRRLFQTLVLQMVVPIICVYLPCASIINVPIFCHVSVNPNLVSAALTFFPVTDAVIYTLASAMSSHLSVRNYLLSFFMKSGSISSIAVSSQQKQQSNY